MSETATHKAIKWVIEDPYLLILEDQMASMTISQEQYDSRLESSQYNMATSR